MFTYLLWEGACFYLGPGHVGIKGNSAADSAAKEALDGDISEEFIPVSDIKSRVNKSVLELWQSEWDEFPDNKLRKIFSDLKDCPICPLTSRREETVISRFHIGQLYITHSFLLNGEEPPMCIACDERLTIEYIWLFCSNFIEKRESPVTAYFISKDDIYFISWVNICNDFKEINIFGRLNFQIIFGSVNVLTTF